VTLGLKSDRSLFRRGLANLGRSSGDVQSSADVAQQVRPRAHREEVHPVPDRKAGVEGYELGGLVAVERGVQRFDAVLLPDGVSVKQEDHRSSFDLFVTTMVAMSLAASKGRFLRCVRTILC
jgi:hypothetical protein